MIVLNNRKRRMLFLGFWVIGLALQIPAQETPRPTPSSTASPLKNSDIQQYESILKSLSPEQLQQLRERLSVPNPNSPPTPGSSATPTPNGGYSAPSNSENKLPLDPYRNPAKEFPGSTQDGTIPNLPNRMGEQPGSRIMDSLEKAQATRRSQRLTDLSRFGTSFFSRSKEELIRSDELAIPDDYEMVPGDQMNITSFNLKGGEMTNLVEVDDKGQFLVPGIGPVNVRGKTKKRVDLQLNQMISSRFKNMRISTTIVKVRKIRVFVLGESVRPGGYLVNPNSTVLDALLQAGGPSATGSYRKIKLERGGQTVATFDLYDLLLHGTTGSPRLVNGDRVFVPLMGPSVAMAGEVQRPALYELRNERTLADVIRLAGGLSPQAYAPALKLERVAENRNRKLVDIPFDRARNTRIEPGDFVYVNSVLEDFSNGVFIDGSVKRPGWYQLSHGMKVSDLVKAAEGLKDGTFAGQSELFRLESRDKPLKMLGFDLSRALIGDPTQNLSLRSEDRIVIYSREEALVDKERVRVQGEVKSPGEFARFSNMRVRDLLDHGWRGDTRGLDDCRNRPTRPKWPFNPHSCGTE